MSTSAKTNPISDRDMIDFMRRESSCTVGELVDFAGVTATAVRQRLRRLMEQDIVVRKVERIGRGRPTHRYSLSPTGIRSGGDNFSDLARVLWDELRSIENPEVRQKLLKRLAGRMGDIYRNEIEGTTILEKMDSLVAIMKRRDVPFEVQVSQDEGQLPVLKALACPYPDLAEQDRAICSLEKMMFSEVLGDQMRLSTCRLDGTIGCTFELSQATTASA
jgi:DeoR family suf operon transcriptional repressor